MHRGTGQVSWDPPPRPRDGERQRAELPISRKHKPKRGRSPLLRGMLAGGWAAPLAMPPKAAAAATTPFTMLTASLPRAPSPFSLLAAKNEDIARARGDSGVIGRPLAHIFFGSRERPLIDSSHSESSSREA